MKLIIIFFLSFPLFLTGQQTSRELGMMPDFVFETSGLIFYNGNLITHNDSGNTPQLFEVDTISLKIVRTVTLTNVNNNDWEDIAQDENYIYIGDFGNYQGIRQDLTIYRISKVEYNSSDTLIAERIEFAYEDQFDLEENGISDWDAEALFVLNDQLIVLTKQLQSEGTVAYSVPKIPGNYIARRLDGFDTAGFVTGATYNPITEILYVVGYTKMLRPLLFRVEGINENSIFSGTVTRTEFAVGQAQVESITYVSANQYMFSSEFLMNENPPINLTSKLFSFVTTDSIIDQEEGEEPEQEAAEEGAEQENSEEGELENTEENPVLEENNNQLILYRSFGSDELNYRLRLDGTIYGMAIFDASGRHVFSIPQTGILNNPIDISTLRPSIYYLTVYASIGVISKPFVLQ